MARYTYMYTVIVFFFYNEHQIDKTMLTYLKYLYCFTQYYNVDYVGIYETKNIWACR